MYHHELLSTLETHEEATEAAFLERLPTGGLVKMALHLAREPRGCNCHSKAEY